MYKSPEKPVVTGIFPRVKTFDNKITLLKSTASRERSRSSISASTSEDEHFQTPPASPSAFCEFVGQNTPPHQPSPPFTPSSPVHRWGESSRREVYLKSDRDFENPDGAISSLILSGSSKARDVFVFPSKKLSTYERDKHLIKITAKLNQIKSPNKEDKTKTILSRLAFLPPCETEKVKILDQQWVKNLDAAVENLPVTSLDRGFDKSIQHTESLKG